MGTKTPATKDINGRINRRGNQVRYADFTGQTAKDIFKHSFCLADETPIFENIILYGRSLKGGYKII